MSENPTASTAPSKKSKSFRLLGGLALALILAVTLSSLLLSMVNYRPSAGILGSSWIEMRNYNKLLSYDPFGGIILNSLWHKLAQLLGGLAVGLPLTALVCLSRKRPGRLLTKAVLCLIPMCIPQIFLYSLVINLLPRQVLMSSASSYVGIILLTALRTGCFFAFCGGLFAYLGCRGIGSGIRQGLLVALLLQALSLLTPDMGSTLLFRNSVTAASSTTLDTMAFQTGLATMNVSYSAAVSNVKLLLQTLLAIVPSILLSRIARMDTSRIDLPRVKRSRLTVLLVCAFWAAALVLALIMLVSTSSAEADAEEWMQVISSAIFSSSLSQSVLYTLMLALPGGLLAALAGYSIILMYRNGRKTFGAMTILLTSSLTCLTSEYVLMRQLGLLRSPLAAILRVIFDPWLVLLVLVMVVVLRMAPERSTRGIVPMLLFFGAACAWGDYLSSYIYPSSQGILPLSTMLYRYTMSGNAAFSGQTLSQAAMQTALLALLALPGILMGALAAAQCFRCFRDAKPHMPSPDKTEDAHDTQAVETKAVPEEEISTWASVFPKAPAPEQTEAPIVAEASAVESPCPPSPETVEHMSVIS